MDSRRINPSTTPKQILISKSTTQPLLRNGQFLRLWAVGWVTGMMMWLELLVIALLTLDLTNSPFLVSLTFFLRFLPMLLGFGIGIIAEKLNRKYMMIVGLIIQATTSASLAILVINNNLAYWHLALGSFVIGAVMASEFPVRRTMIGEVVDRKSAGRALSLEQTTNSLFRIPGPFIGGVFLATIGPQGGFLLGVALYAIGILVAMSMHYQRPNKNEPFKHPKTQIIEGIHYISRHQVMIGTLGVTLIINVFGFSYVSQQPVVAKQVLNASDILVGVLQSVEGTGAFIGAALIAIFAKPQHYTRIFMWGSSLFVIAIILFSQSTIYWVTLIILFFGGVGMSAFATMQSAIIIYTSTPQMRGRVLGSVAVFIGIGPFGQLAIGALADILNPATAVLITAGFGLACMAIAF
ncbi:MAG: MFS transporter, partial [SAR202 cluster bacterium]|nr:MFS transporter [SAR202 cluster bacterium]